MFLLGLAACHPTRHTPEGRAQDFIEALVTAPADAQNLRDIASISPERNPEDLVDDLSARVALDFLRARQAQGVALVFSQGEARRIDAGRRAVMILVTNPQAGTRTNDEARFQVLLEKDKEGQWHIAHVTGGN